MAEFRIAFGAKTDVGRRQNNEDKELAIRLLPDCPDTYLLAVADGMGGGVAGEIASATVIEELERYIRDRINWSTGPSELKGILSEAYERVQLRVQEKVDANPELAGMGTTLTVLLLHDGYYVWGNIGDSRLYRLDREGAIQLTRDHSHIQEMIDRGEEPDMAYIRKYSNLITRSISGPIEESDIYPMEADGTRGVPDALQLKPETAFLLCSDGLITFSPEEEIRAAIDRIYFSGKILDQVFDDLISYATKEQSRDNITVAALEYGIEGRRRMQSRASGKVAGRPESPVRQGEGSSKPAKVRKQLAISIPLILILGALLAALVFSNPEQKKIRAKHKSTPCEWSNQINPSLYVSDGAPKVNVGSYSCPEDGARIFLILHLDSGADTLEDMEGDGLIDLSPYRQTHLNETLQASTIAVLKDTVLQGKDAKIIIR